MKKISLFAIILCLLTLNSFAAYLTFEPVTVNQPNNVILNIYASGDEFYNWLHDKDGYTIIQDEYTGYYCYAVPEGNKLIASKYIVGVSSPFIAGIQKWLTIPETEIYKKRQEFYNKSPKDMGDAPKTGNINNLVVYIRFAGENEFTDSAAFYNRLFNYSATSNGNSMKNYFKEVSYNKLNINTTFYPTTSNVFVASYQDTAIRAYFKPYNATTNPLGYTTSNKTEREHSLLNRACQYVANMVPDTLNLDGDNDGKIDNVCFIVYGSNTAWADLLWPHMWSLYSQTVMIRGKRVYTYNFQLQNSLKSSGVGVLCHEMFHSLGAPDLYHYTSNGISPMSRWDVMDANQNPPQHMCAHMKMKYGTWISSIPTISAPGTYTMKYLLSPTNNAYKITTSLSSIEYFVVEFRRKLSTFESMIPGDGMIIIRINSTRNGNANGPPDEVYAYRPNGTLTANGIPNSANYCVEVGRTAINNATNPTPFLLDGTQGGLNIYNIGSYQDSIISFTLGTITSVANNGIPVRTSLSQNYPNPFNPSTEIAYSIAKSGFVSLKIYDLLGREVSVLVNENQKPGEYKIKYDASALTSGIYFYKITTNDYTDIKRMMFIK
jgi:M6 family metalloprotease-like protein